MSSFISSFSHRLDSGTDYTTALCITDLLSSSLLRSGRARQQPRSDWSACGQPDVTTIELMQTRRREAETNPSFDLFENLDVPLADLPEHPIYLFLKP